MQHQLKLSTMALGAASVYIAALVGPVFLEHHDDVDEGVLWGWSETVQRSSVLLLIVAVAGAFALISAVVLVPRLALGPALRIAATGGALFAFGAIPAVAIDGPPTYGSVVLLPASALVVVPLLVAGAAVSRTRRRLSILLHMAGGVAPVLAVAFAATYDDNASDPMRFDVALAILALPLAIAAIGRLGRQWTAIVLALCGVHLAGLVAVIVAATSCDDDDCIPAPAWLIAATLAVVWSCAARLVRPQRRLESGESHGGAQPDIVVDSLSRPSTLEAVSPRLAVLAAPVVLSLIGIGVGTMIDTNRAPTTFAAAPDSLNAELPGMLGWTSDRVCERRDDPSNSSDTVVIVGSELAESSRVEVCFARFTKWMAPTPQAAIIEQGVDASFSPASGRVVPQTALYASSPVEPDTAMRYARHDGGRHELWVDETLIFEAVGGLDYSLRSYGLSDDGTWAFVADSLDRLIVMPTDGSRAPVVLDDALDERSEVEWGPGATFQKSVANLRDPGASTYIPDDVDINLTRQLISNQADALEESVIVEFVVIDDAVWAQFINLPPLDATERGLCVGLSTWMTSDPTDRLLTQSIVGDGGPACRSEAESDGWRCGNVLTLPTLALADALTEDDTLSMNATLFIPLTVPGFEGRLTGLQRERRNYGLGPVVAGDLPQLDLSDVRCGDQPTGAGRRTVPEPGEPIAPKPTDTGLNLDLRPGSQDIQAIVGRDQLIDALMFNYGGYDIDTATCIADVLGRHADDDDVTVEVVPAVRLRIALDATHCVSHIPGPLLGAPAPGIDAYGDELWAACVAGFGLDCDSLSTSLDRRYSDFGRSCGGRNVITIGCALLLHGELADLDWTNGDPDGLFDLTLVPGPDTEAPGWTAVYDVLWEPCASGDDDACRDLAGESPDGSMYQAFALTCGGRTPEPSCARI